MFFMSHRAYAMTQSTYIMSVSMGEYAWTCNSTINPDKSSYSPGDTMTLNIGATLAGDAGATSGDGNCYVFVFNNSSNTSIAFDGAAAGNPNTIFSYTIVAPGTGVRRVGSSSGSYSFTLPGSLSVGSHNIQYVQTAVSGGVRGSAGGKPTATGALSFSIVAAPQPSVQLFFSYVGDILEKLFG